MCGIAGFCGEFPQNLLVKMNQIQRHRGPDDEGVYFDEINQLGLAHRRLSIIDLSKQARQPMWDMFGRVAIVFNGEIYNYKELRKNLEKEGFFFNNLSDTEVILNLYLREGEKLLSRLNGIFAFAIWDSRSETLFIARDGVGVKPLYYTVNEKGFLFASEIKAILQDTSVDRALDHTAIHQYLTYLWSPAPRTILKSVLKLEPGYAMRVGRGKIKKQWQFYDLPYNNCIRKITVEDAVAEIRSHLAVAVNRQMIADVPVGAFLSGGLDSSAIVAYAQRCLPPGQKLQCFTIGFHDDALQKEGMVDDLPYARKVADYLGVDLHTIFVGPEMTDQLEKMLYHLDEPQADPAPLNALFISELARKHDIKVLLSGAGGDDIFSGYRRHMALSLEKYWSWLPCFARQLLADVTDLVPKQFPGGRRLAKAFQYAGLSGNDRIASYFFWSKREMLHDLYSQEFIEEMDFAQYQEPLAESLSHVSPAMPALNKMLYLESKHFLADHNLNYTDKMSMATGVEVRVPLLDRDLVDLAASIPVSYKQKGRVGKWIFKKAMEPYLPNDVIYRPKTGFGAPLRRWLRNELRPVVEDVLSERSLKRRGLFKPQAVAGLIERDRKEQIDGTYTIFALMCIEMWCRIFLDHPTPQRPF